jgi:glucose/arabinose dehydrogenase
MRNWVYGIATPFLFLALFASPASAQQIKSTFLVGGLTDPVAFVQDPTDPAVQLVVEQTGHIKIVLNGQLQPDDFLDLSGVVVNEGERGLLGFTFAPDYASSGRMFVMFVNADSNSVVSRFTRSEDNALRANPDSRFDLIWPGGTPYIPQPFTNHKGGNLVFGPDGYLYFGTGDGGAGFDPFNLAQDPQSLLGKMLRIDVAVPDNHPTGYEIPPTNPFAGSETVLNEIWALGLRNPWRWSFDDPARGGTGALIIADVGQNEYEEIDYQPAGQGGRNYGWRVREGRHDLITDPGPFSELTDPIYEYQHPIGFCITGGFVYRGSALGSAFVGRYFFADFITNMLWSAGLYIDPNTGEAAVADIAEHQETAGGGGQGVVSFGVDMAGELYTVNRWEGAIYKLELDPTPPPTPFVRSDFIVWNADSGNWSVLPASNNWSQGVTLISGGCPATCRSAPTSTATGCLIWLCTGRRPARGTSASRRAPTATRAGRPISGAFPATSRWRATTTATARRTSSSTGRQTACGTSGFQVTATPTQPGLRISGASRATCRSPVTSTAITLATWSSTDHRTACGTSATRVTATATRPGSATSGDCRATLPCRAITTATAGRIWPSIVRATATGSCAIPAATTATKAGSRSSGVRPATFRRRATTTATAAPTLCFGVRQLASGWCDSREATTT